MLQLFKKPRLRRSRPERSVRRFKQKPQKNKTPKLSLGIRSIMALGILVFILIIQYTPLSAAQSLTKVFNTVFSAHVTFNEIGDFVASMGPQGEKLMVALGYQIEEPPTVPVAVVPIQPDKIPQFPLPVVGVVASTFDMVQNGIKVVANQGYPVISVFGGRVIAIEELPDLGLTVTINHGQGLHSIYGHLGGVAVSEGDDVGPGKVVGYVGDSGEVTTPMLHFALSLEGSMLDPLQYIQGK